MKNPIFKHDCNKCEFVRTDTYDKKLSDFYLCDNSMIIRHSDEPSDYGSFRIEAESKLKLLGIGVK